MLVSISAPPCGGPHAGRLVSVGPGRDRRDLRDILPGALRCPTWPRSGKAGASSCSGVAA